MDASNTGRRQTRGVDALTRAFTNLVDSHRASIPFAILALAIAILLGGMHALAPGHALSVAGMLSEGVAHFDSGTGSDDVNRQRLSTLSVESPRGPVLVWVSDVASFKPGDFVQLQTVVQPA